MGASLLCYVHGQEGSCTACVVEGTRLLVLPAHWRDGELGCLGSCGAGGSWAVHRMPAQFRGRGEAGLLAALGPGWQGVEESMSCLHVMGESWIAHTTGGDSGRRVLMGCVALGL